MNARGATLTDADGHHLSDFCLGDTAAMFGHSPDAVVQALARRRPARAHCALTPSLVCDAARRPLRIQFCATPPRNGNEASATFDTELEHLIHLALLNRGVLITPFHNMMLVYPATTTHDAQRLLDAFDDVLGAIAQG